MSGTEQTARILRQIFTMEDQQACERQAMQKVSLTEVMLTTIERPRCDRCRTRMMLARITPLSDGSEKRIFQCTKCHFIETKTVVDPLKSDIVERLTTNIRPPI
jgi:Zn-finger protein